MESKMVKIKARYDNRIELKVYPGHFATPQLSHHPLHGSYNHAYP